MNIQP